MQPVLELGFSKQKRNKPTETTLLVLLPENSSLLIAPSTSANCKAQLICTQKSVSALHTASLFFLKNKLWIVSNLFSVVCLKGLEAFLHILLGYCYN
ncbi:hypothetical protein K1719_002509 [Acacia pycnantha]|nr:hypothetical protein K1719_002509 [Acacia pycnantha]